MMNLDKFMNSLNSRDASLKRSTNVNNLKSMAEQIIASESYGTYNKYSALRDINNRIHELTRQYDEQIKKTADEYWREYSKIEDEACDKANMESFFKHMDEFKRKGLLNELSFNHRVSCKIHGKRCRVYGTLSTDNHGNLILIGNPGPDWTNPVYTLDFVGERHNWHAKGSFGERFAQNIIRNGIKIAR